MRRKKAAMILLTILMLSSTVVLAKSEAKDIRVYDSDSKIFVDGKEVSLSSTPFVYNGTTYLPVREVSTVLGEQIGFSPTRNAIYIGSQPGEKQYLTETLAPVNQLFGEIYRQDYKTKVEMYGKTYSTAIVLNRGNGAMEFNLDGKYSKVTADLGIRGNISEDARIEIKVYRDSEEYHTYKLYGNASEAQEIEIPVQGTKMLKFYMDDWRKGSAVAAFGDPMITWEAK